jgi:hypothetical protein
VVRRAASSYPAHRGLHVAGHLVQMAANRREPVLRREAAVAVQRVEAGQPGARAGDHRDPDRSVEHDDRARRQRVQEVVELEDLRPVGIDSESAG